MFEELYDNLEVVDAGQPGWQSSVLSALRSKEMHTITPLKSILNIAQQHGVRTVVVEDKYIDTDFLDEFRSWYSRSFQTYESYCKRLHFFTGTFTKKQLPRLNLAKKGYLGFSVVRPLRSFCTGRTVLISPKHDGDTMFTLCTTTFKVNLAGNKLSVCGMPYIQQDTNVGVCAQAAIWMTSLYMHEKFAFPRFKPSEITEAATKTLTIGPARSGLVPQQIIAALRDMGYAPVIFTHYDPDVTAKIVYAYVESELPVILLLEGKRGGHAVVVCGHDFHPRRHARPSPQSNMHWIDRFYTHDDANSPYIDILLRGHAIKKKNAKYSIKQNAAYVVVPVPPQITMQADDVFDHVATLMEHLNDFIGFFGHQALEFSFSEKELAGLILRTYLRSSNDFKVSLSVKMSELFLQRYKSMPMPRYIWVTEISLPNHIRKAHSKDRRIIGEIIIDSTADRHAHTASYLAIHLLGRMIVRRAEGDEPYALYVDPTEQPYSHLVRQS